MNKCSDSTYGFVSLTLSDLDLIYPLMIVKNRTTFLTYSTIFAS